MDRVSFPLRPNSYTSHGRKLTGSADSDHDLDTPAQSRLNVFTARGLLVETDGPVWFWGGASEHAVLYQYNFDHASNVYIGHMQTESPYFQPTPNSVDVFPLGVYDSDPKFEDCTPSSKLCLLSWALVIRNSHDILIYGAGLYSWFQSFGQSCLGPEDCQQRLVQTDYSQGIWMFSQYTKGALECVSPLGGIAPTIQEDNRNGFLTAISAWIPLAFTGANIGGFTPVEDHPTPNGLVPVDGLSGACGDIQCGQTLTLSAECASAIAALPTSGANNNPPGPENCQETCDIFRLVTGTCCGDGGSTCFGIEIPPGQPVPAPFPITSGFNPPSATYSAPGFDPTGHPTTTTYDPQHTSDHDFWFPPLWIPIPIGSPPLIVPPPVDLPDDDPDGYLFIVDEVDANSWADIHPPSGTNPPTTTTTPDPPVYTPPAAGPFDVIIPSGHGVDCHTDVDATDLDQCYQHVFDGFDTGTTYSSNDEICFGTGDVVLNGVHIGGYCILAGGPGCSLVWGIADSFGISPIYRFTGQQLRNFLDDASGKCGNGPASAIATTDRDPNGFPLGWSLSFCLVHEGQEAACGTNQGFPNP